MEELIMPVAEMDKMDALKEYIASLKGSRHPESDLIAVLHKSQELHGFVSQEAMDLIGQEMQIPTAHVWGVATFYHYFNLTAPGKYVISVCIGTACYVKGAGEVMEAIKDELGIEEGETTADGMFSLHGARCLGACGLAPVVMVNDKMHGNLNRDTVRKLLKEYRRKG
jgi:NADH:ubiquinone oxidoreductase subunit E